MAILANNNVTLTTAQMRTLAKVLEKYGYAVGKQKGFSIATITKAIAGGATMRSFVADSDGLVTIKTVKVATKPEKIIHEEEDNDVEVKKTRTEAINQWCEEKGYTEADRKAFGKANYDVRKYLSDMAKKNGKYWTKKQYSKLKDGMVALVIEEGLTVAKAYKQITEPKTVVATTTKKSDKKVEKAASEFVTHSDLTKALANNNKTLLKEMRAMLKK